MEIRMRTQTLLNMTEAAEMVGMKRPTFYRKVKEKGDSTTIDGGKQKVDVSELIRVFGSDLKLNNKQNGTSERRNTESKPSKTVSTDGQQNNQAGNTHEKEIEIVKLSAELDKEKELKRQADEQVEYLKSQLEDEKSERRKAHALLTDKSKEKDSGAGEWEKSLKALENRLANQEKVSKETAEKEQKIIRQNRALKRALDEERNKSFFKKLFG